MNLLRNRVQLCAALLATALLAIPGVSQAYAWVWVANVSQLQYQTNPDGRVYLRNLNQFNASAAGCCYNYYFDTNTAEGKAIFALFLAKAAQGAGLQIGVPNGFAPGVITNVGEW